MSDPQSKPESERRNLAMPVASNAIQPGPIPTSADIGTAQFGEHRTLVLSLSTPLGTQHYFFDADGATQLARALQRTSRDIMTWESVMSKKLVVPGKKA